MHGLKNLSCAQQSLTLGLDTLYACVCIWSISKHEVCQLSTGQSVDITTGRFQWTSRYLFWKAPCWVSSTSHHYDHPLNDLLRSNSVNTNQEITFFWTWVFIHYPGSSHIDIVYIDTGLLECFFRKFWNTVVMGRFSTDKGTNLHTLCVF